MAYMTFSIPAMLEGPRLAAGLVKLGIAAVTSPRVGNRLHELAEVIERDRLLRPAVACQVLPFSCRESEPERWHIGDRALPGAVLDRLAGATEVAVVFVTVGAAWSEASTASFQRGDALRGYLLDEIGTNVLERLSLRVEALIRMAARASGRRAGSPIEPGHAVLPLALQPMLAQLAQVQTAGIAITDGGMISPPKSISMLIGIGGNVRRWTHAHACRECPSFTKCRHQGRRS